MIRYESFFPSVDVKDLHQDKIYQRELALARAFVEKMPAKDELDPCPVSGRQRHEILFEKWGCRYAFCPQTWTLSLGSLPDDDTKMKYFFDSDLSRYRSSGTYQRTIAKLRQELWTGQVEWIEGRVRRYLGMDQYRLIDWGPRILGWVETVRSANFLSEYYVAEPLPPVTESSQVEAAEIVLLFDVIQRCTEPAKLLSDAFNALNPGGILLLTCRSGSGFDILTLAGQSESIFPLDHICLPSPEGISLLLDQVGFEILELATPGLLDVQLVRQAGAQMPLEQRFQRYLLNQPGQTQERLQGFLQQNNLSSHLRLVAKKPEK